MVDSIYFYFFLLFYFSSILFSEPHKLNGQQARWYLKLQDYDFILQHISGEDKYKDRYLIKKESSRYEE